jgi:hypothetical protein
MKRSSWLNRVLLIVGGAIAIAIAASASVAFLSESNEPFAQSKSNESEVRTIRRAVFADGRLWVLLNDASLVSLGSNEANPEQVLMREGIVDICNSAHRLVVVAVDDQDKWTVQRRSPDGWVSLAVVPTKGESFGALACESDDAVVALITFERVIKVDGKKVRTVQVNGRFEPPLTIATALASEGAIWVGYDAGEWGGGLKRIDDRSGEIETVERNRSGSLCGGPLNSACDPVQAMTKSPWSKSCILAAIGLEHLLPHGRIVEVCEDSIRRLYFKRLDPQPPNNTLDDGEPAITVPFYGLARSGNVVWAVGTDGIYRFDGRDPPRFQRWPHFEDRGGYPVSFEVPGIVLVKSKKNEQASPGGSVPIIAVR